MAKIAAHNAAVHWDEFDLSGYLNTVTLNITQESLVTTALQDAGPRRIPGNYDWNVSYAGLGDYVDDAIDEITNTDFDDNAHYLCVCPAGDATVGNICYDGPTREITRAHAAAAGAATALALTADGAAGLSRAQVLWGRDTAITGTGNGTGVNQGATTSGQTYRLVVRVEADNFSDLDIKLQESSDDGSADAYADVASMTANNLSGVGITVVTTTAATEAWKRVVVSGFTGTSASVLIVGGVVEES